MRRVTSDRVFDEDTRQYRMRDILQFRSEYASDRVPIVSASCSKTQYTPLHYVSVPAEASDDLHGDVIVIQKNPVTSPDPNDPLVEISITALTLSNPMRFRLFLGIRCMLFVLYTKILSTAPPLILLSSVLL